MTPKQEAALRQALEALEHEADIGNDNAYQRERDAIREALAEQQSGIKQVIELYDSPEQECFYCGGKNGDHGSRCPTQQQEPVAWCLFVNGEPAWDSDWAFSNEPFPVQFDDEECRPLYTTPQPAVPDGWKLVPVEPTEAMLKAMDECSTEGYDERLLAGHAWSVYTAAIDAAPQHGIKGDA